MSRCQIIVLLGPAPGNGKISRKLGLKHIRIINRIQGAGAYMRSLKQQDSLWAHDTACSRYLVGTGHRFGKVSVLAIIQSKIYLKKLERTLNADLLKFNGWFAQIHLA